MAETPPFTEALAAFSRFIEEQGFSTELAWVFQEDVATCGRDYCVRLSMSEVNAKLAQEYYEFGRHQGLGVTLEVFCRVEKRSACFVWVPEDQTAAEYAMQGPLNCKVPAIPIDAVLIRTRLAWWFQTWLNRLRGSTSAAEYLPRRSDVLRTVKV